MLLNKGLRSVWINDPVQLNQGTHVMSTITISNADWEILEAVPASAVNIDSVTGSLITVSVDLGDGRTAIFLISGAWTGVSGTSLAGLMGTVSGISMLIDGITQFDATGLAFDVTEVTEEILAEVTVLVELALGDSAEIIGSDDDDSLSGTAGNDSVSGNLGDDDLFGDLGDDSLSGGDGFDALDGGDGNDTLSGGVGDDSLTGGGGNDRLYAGSGTDTLIGGMGNDYYYVDSSADAIVEGSSGGTDTEVASFSDTLDVEIENLILTGSAALNGTGNAANNVMTGNTGANSLSGGLGNDKLNGGDGDDSLKGGDGADSLTGGNGNDRLYAGTGTGTDTLTGGAGNDVYYVDSSADVIIEGSSGGIDTEVASFSDTLDAGIENLVLSGLAALYGTGNAANNVMTGNAAANTLLGGLGDDLLRGGAGNDILYGGAGRDIFRFDAILGSASTPNLDQIKDFSVTDDTIQLENSIFTAFGASTTGAINAGCFKSNTTGLAADSNDYMIYETDTGKLFFDADGSGAGDAVQIGLLGVNLALTNADFVLV